MRQIITPPKVFLTEDLAILPLIPKFAYDCVPDLITFQWKLFVFFVLQKIVDSLMNYEIYIKTIL